MWILLLLAVHGTNPADIPGRIELKFQTKEACEYSLHTLAYKLKFSSYKVIGECKQN